MGKQTGTPPVQVEADGTLRINLKQLEDGRPYHFEVRGKRYFVVMQAGQVLEVYEVN